MIFSFWLKKLRFAITQMTQLSMCAIRSWNRLLQALKMMVKGSLSGSSINSMKVNPDKCHLLIFGGKNTDVSVHIGETMVTESVEDKLLGVTLDKNLDFKSHVNAICK